MTVIRLIIGLIMAGLTFASFLGLVIYFPIINQNWASYQWFIAGIVTYIAVIGIENTFTNSNFKFFRTFTHELTHTIFTILSFKRIRQFKATSHQGGEVHVVGGGNMLILLSPYCIPIYTLLLIIVKPLLQLKFIPLIESAIGLTYFFHLHTNWLQTSSYQTDINKYPLFTSYSFISFFQLLLFGIIMVSFLEGLDAFWKVPQTSIKRLMALFSYYAT